ncbi:methylmalonyl-CoA mutase, beta subunit, partial [Streptomyces himastatinicus ATCC 53653]
MTVLPDGLSLADEFPDVTRDEWHRLVEGVLRKTGASDATGVHAEEALATEVEDGITVRPLYTSEDAPQDPGHPGYPGFAPYLRGARAAGSAVSGWDVRQRHAHPDAGTTNRAVLADLENGAGSVWLAVGEGGVAVDALPEALAGVYLDLAPVVLDAGPDFEAAGRALLRLYADRQVPPHAALGNLGADPLGLVARTGRDADLPAHLAAAADLAVTCYRDHRGVRALTVDALPYHEAGGGVAQELGCSLAAGVAYLRALTGAGMTVEAACAELEFRYAATADQFTTTAKLRAARRLWARVAEACGASTGSAETAQRQHAVTSPVMMTRRDPWVNMLRTTVASLAAGVGGADAVTVLPFDSAIGLPDDFARRIARPALHDPAGGVGAGPGERPGRWLLVRRIADRGDLPRRVGLVPGDRAGRGTGRRPRLRAGARPAGRHLGAPLARPRQPQGADHRRERVPQPGRAAGPARGRARAVRRRAAAGAPRRGVRGAPRPLRRAAGRPGRPAPGVPGRAGTPRPCTPPAP